MGVQRLLSPIPRKGFQCGDPGTEQRAEVQDSCSQAWQEPTAQLQNPAKAEKSEPPLWSQMRIYLPRGIFTNCHLENHFSYQNNPPPFPEDSASCSCGSPQEEV